MTEHEPTPDLLDLASDMFREAIEKHMAVEDNRDLIHQTFDDLVEKAFGSGHVVVTGRQLKRLTKDYLWARLNNRAGRATQSLLKALVAGQLPIAGVDELLVTPITAGAARRTLIRDLNKLDVERMVAEREHNMAKQVAATVEFRDDIAATLNDWLDEYGSIPKAIKAGAVEFTVPEADAESA